MNRKPHDTQPDFIGKAFVFGIGLGVGTAIFLFFVWLLIQHL